MALFHVMGLPWRQANDRSEEVASVLDKVLRVGEGRQLKKLQSVATATNALESTISAMSDEELKAQTAKFKERLHNGESLSLIHI